MIQKPWTNTKLVRSMNSRFKFLWLGVEVQNMCRRLTDASIQAEKELCDSVDRGPGEV